MTAYYNDLKLFFQKAGAFRGQKVVLHVEPDLWGYMQQRATNDDAKTVPAKVSETGLPQLAGLPSNVSGFARAIVKLRDTYAPNVILGYHISVWGTGVDIALSDPSDAQVDALGGRAAAFYNSLGADFDIAFASSATATRPSTSTSTGTAANAGGTPRTSAVTLVSSAASPRGRQADRALADSARQHTDAGAEQQPGHYQDNRPEWLLDEPARTHLTAYVDAGVVAFLFGGGAGGVTLRLRRGRATA